MNWYFIRHGEIESNKNKIYAGWSEEELNARGHKQADKAANKISPYEIHKIYTSPIHRAHKTAQIIGSKIGLKPIKLNSFKELKMGPWEGLSELQITQRFPLEWKIWNDTPANLDLPNRETLQQLFTRVLNGLNKIKQKDDGLNIVIVTHVAIIRILDLYCKKADLNQYRTIKCPVNGDVYHWDGRSKLSLI